MTSPTHHPLAHLRAQRNWSLADVAGIVARRSGLNMAQARQKPYRWEHGVVPEAEAQKALADELGISHAAVADLGWPHWLCLAYRDEPVSSAWTPQAAQEVLDTVAKTAPFDRRGFLVLSGASLATLATTHTLTPTAAIAHGLRGNRIGAEAVSHINDRVRHLSHLDDEVGGRLCLDAAVSDLRIIGSMIRNATSTPQVTRDLWAASAATCRLAGWTAFDAGFDAAAQRLWHAGLRSAHTARDVGQTVYILSCMALQQIYSGDSREAVNLLEGARAQSDPSQHTVGALLDAWQVRAHARLGEHDTALRVLDRGDSRWGKRRPGADPDWVYWMRQPSRTSEVGTAMIEMGRFDEAEQILEAGRGGLEQDYTRDRSLYNLRLTELHLAAGRHDQAAASLDLIAADTGSGRVDRLVSSATQRLGRRRAA